MIEEKKEKKEIRHLEAKEKEIKRKLKYPIKASVDEFDLVIDKDDVTVRVNKRLVHKRNSEYGYKVVLKKDGRIITRSVRSLVYRAVFGKELAAGNKVYAIDGDKYNNNPENLTVICPQTIKEGSGRKLALTDKEIEEIEKRLSQTPIYVLARDYNVCSHTIRKVKQGTYK